MSVFTPRHEEISGSDLTGSSGTINRTYALANSDAVAAQMQVARAGAFLQQGPGFTFDASTNTITFVTAVWDSQLITLDYLTEDETAAATTTYANTLQMSRFGGLGLAIELESLGTGDGSEDSYDTNKGNIVASSYTLYYGDVNDNSLSTLTESTHYTLYKDSGRVLLTSAGKALVNAKVIYISYTYSLIQSDTILATYLGPASREAEKITGNYWGPVKTSYDYFDGYDSGYPQTDEPYGTQIEDYAEFELKYKSVATITSVLFLDRQGNTDTTLESTSYRLITDDPNQESRLLVNVTIPNGKANVKATYTHGYATVPELVQELTALIASVMAFVNITGGAYEAITSWTLGRKNFVQGEQWVNLRETISQVNGRINEITNDLGGNFDCV